MACGQFEKFKENWISLAIKSEIVLCQKKKNLRVFVNSLVNAWVHDSEGLLDIGGEGESQAF